MQSLFISDMAQEVCVGKVLDVYLISDARTVLCRPVVAEDLHSIAVA